MKELDEIDHLFKETFDGFEVIPEPSVKEKIDRSLASEKRRRRFLLIFLPLLALSMTATIIALIYIPSGRPTVVTHEKTGFVKTGPADTNTEKKPLAVNNAAIDEVVKRTDHAQTGQWSVSRNSLSREIGKKNGEVDDKIVEEQMFVTIEQKQRMNTLHAENNVIDTTTTPVSDNSLPDSSDAKSPELTAIQNELPQDPAKAETGSRWYMTGFAGWEGEWAKPIESLNSNDVSNAGKEFAGIRSSSFYGKVEMNYQLPVGLDLIAGLGFRSTEVSQQAIHYVRDSLPEYEDITTSAPTAYTYFAREDQGQQTFRVNSLIMPIGIAGSLAVGRSFMLRCSAGTEFSYGWLNNVQLQPGFSQPVFRPFGWNVWVRPELHYPIGRWRLIAYGTFNQVLYQQLKWEVTSSKRNPLFGAGIGVSVRL